MAIHLQAEKIASYVWYEWEMLRETAYRVNKVEDRVTKNALLESFLLHLRVLKDFFYGEPKSRHNDDVFAIHFFKNATDWQNHRPSLGAYFAEHEKRLQKMLAHLSYDRPNWHDELKSWDIEILNSEVEAIWNCFYNLLPAERQAWFHAPRI